MLIMSSKSSSSSARVQVQVQVQSQALATHASSAAPRNLLISIADHIHRSSDLPSARRLISCLLASSSPVSDSVDDRIAHQFLLALALALALRISINSSSISIINPSTSSSSSSSSVVVVDHEQISQSSYLSLNQITPFLRFCHLTANQAILDSLTATTTCLHILDFDTLHGLQWPPLLQALAERNANISVRITGTGSDLSLLRRTAARLHSFAASLNLPFHFHPLLLTTTNNTTTPSYDPSSLVQLYPNETLAVNCVMFLSKLMRDGNLFDPEGSREVRSLLRAVRAMNPAIVTVAEKEANFSSPHFFTRFMEALDYYTAVFESLEGTLPAGNRERMEVEQVWFGKEIADVVAGDQQHQHQHHHQLMRRRERSLRFEKWEEILRGEGLRSRALSPFAVSQARLLLRLHYPSEGYQLKIRDDHHALFLGWQDKPLFSVSSWH